MRSLLTIIFICFSFFQTWSQILPKSVDGTFTDWNNSDFSVDDSGDSQELDITKVSISNDLERLFILIETNMEFDIQDEEDITVFIDADNNPNTGFSRGGIGAEFTYYYSVKRGFINMADGSSIEVNHAALGAMSSPTVSSDKFELVLNRSVQEGGFSASMGSTISILIENDGAGDIVPNTPGGIQYTLISNPAFESSYNLDKNIDHTRFMSYNVLQDGLYEPTRLEEFKKIFQATNPDVIAFQEMYSTDPIDVTDFLTTFLPGSNWDVVKSNPDIILATRYDIEAWDAIDGNAVFLVYDDNENPLIIYNVHLPCCDNDIDRQREIDNLLSVLRDKGASSQTGFLYPDDAPTIITGDFNLVGLKQNYDSFIEGDIVDNNTFGQDFNPDWDGSTLEDANPYVTGFPANYTWNNPNGSYHPGKLDFMFYTGSVMEQQNAFVLDTEYLSMDELNNYQLSSNSTTIASDHLPLIVDFTFGITQEVDEDNDGFDASVDCNDNDPNIFPGATEICDQIDNNCDGQIDEGIAFVTFYIDGDMDGYGDSNNSIVSCMQPPGTSSVGGDCNDSDASINPNMPEICNGFDDNCNGLIDDNDPSLSPSTLWYQDQDGDGFGNPVLTINACVMPTGYTANNTDCDDTNPMVNPNSSEVCDNLDNNCDGMIDEGISTNTYYQDNDMDGYGDSNLTIDDCTQPNGYVLEGGDCDDASANVFPGAMEIPNNGIDENCDGVDDTVDLDGDGFNSDEDCNDNDPNINPNVSELCDGIDNNCDGNIDEGISINTYYLDNDMDGYGDSNLTIDDCVQPEGYVLEGGDCDDASANVYPGAEEMCDELDNNCDGSIDEGIPVDTVYTDLDFDGYGDDDTQSISCLPFIEVVFIGGDCDDNNPDIYPGAPEILDNGIDEDCNGSDLSDIHEVNGITFSVFPNPVSTALYIELDKAISYSAKLISATGEIVIYQEKLTGNSELNTSNLPKGIYALWIKDLDNSFEINDRIIVL